jgi:hypothetical protein
VDGVINPAFTLVPDSCSRVPISRCFVIPQHHQLTGIAQPVETGGSARSQNHTQAKLPGLVNPFYPPSTLFILEVDVRLVLAAMATCHPLSISDPERTSGCDGLRSFSGSNSSVRELGSGSGSSSGNGGMRVGTRNEELRTLDGTRFGARDTEEDAGLLGWEDGGCRG